MELQDLIERFRDSRLHQQKAIFSTLFIAGNQIQTIFDNDETDVTLKQFMLLTMVHQANEQVTFTQFGKLLGCSRQNVKKIAEVLEKKGYVKISSSAQDVRASCIEPTQKLHTYFEEIADYHLVCLQQLFSVYSDEELQQLFHLLMRLYQGVDALKETMK